VAEQADTRLWSVVVFLGVGIGFALGAIVVMLFRDRRYISAIGGAQPQQLGFPQQPLAFDTTFEPLAAPTMPHASAARSVTVGTTPVQLIRALGIKPWKVQVRTVNPPGAYARFSTSNNPGEMLTIAAGDFHEMWLSPGEDLYAQASKAGVMVSVSGGEAT